MAAISSNDVNNWARLTPELQQRVAGFLPIADAVFNLKFVDRETYASVHAIYKSVKLGNGGEPWPGDAFSRHWSQPRPWRALTARRRHRLLCLAAGSGHAASLRAAISNCGCVLDSAAMAAAAAVGDLAACDALMQAGCCWGDEVATAAAEGGHVPVLDWLRQQGFDFWGHTAMKRQFLQRSYEMYAAPRAVACRAGHAHVLAWFDTHDVFCEPADAHCQVQAAAEGGHVELALRLLDNLESGEDRRPPWLRRGRAGPSRREREVELAAGLAVGGSLAQLQQHCGARVAELLAPQPNEAGGGGGGARRDSRPDLIAAAAFSCTPDWVAKLDWLLSQRARLRQQQHPRAPANADTDGSATAQGGGGGGGSGGGLRISVEGMHCIPRWAASQPAPAFLERLRLLHARGLHLDASMLDCAAEAGDLACLAFLINECGIQARRARGGPAAAAARAGHVHVLAWLDDTCGVEPSAWDLEQARGPAAAWLVRAGLERAKQQDEQRGAELDEQQVWDLAGNRVGPYCANARQGWLVWAAAAQCCGEAEVVRWVVEECGARVNLPALLLEAGLDVLEWAAARVQAQAQAQALEATGRITWNRQHKAMMNGNLAAVAWAREQPWLAAALPATAVLFDGTLIAQQGTFSYMYWELQQLLRRREAKVPPSMWRYYAKDVRRARKLTPRQLVLLAEVGVELEARGWSWGPQPQILYDDDEDGD
ncbi:hypothetical protein HYH02_007057 [Chlamydomonas schloesseri]|uniref:Ankyrin repeat domain-containing protein n=1 Tax=Chlamydomonas schloesseri TaxID=2026947 RepID=A0A835WIE9_9CHLO|nr:hypothetical protein HYH02_007057 [Chlamydomonas schloesseri]|eukprot:KAG2448030.1 hypothetical protein HYH02_007057 [Chlamydomonas schloesseri]